MTIFNQAKRQGNKLGKGTSRTAAILTLAVATLMTMGSVGTNFADTSANKPNLAICPPMVTSPNTATILPGGCIQVPIGKTAVINGKTVDLTGVYKSYRSDVGELMVPVKALSQDLGMKVTWKASSKSVEIVHQGKTVVIPITGERMTKIADREYHTDIIEGKLFMPHWAFAELFECVVADTADNGFIMDSQKQMADEASTVGEIMEVTTGKDGVQILVKGHATGSFGLGTVSLSVSHQVPVMTATGGKVENAVAGTVLKKGDQIYVQYGKALTRSIPAMGQATSVTILKDCNVMTGKIYDVAPLKLTSDSGTLHVIGSDDYVLHLDPKVVLVDDQGKALKYSDFKSGQMVRVYIAQFSTMSIPAQTTAYRVEVIR